jgi:hypothetical protein
VASRAVGDAVICGQIDAQRLESTWRLSVINLQQRPLQEIDSTPMMVDQKFRDSNSSLVHG